MNKKLKEKLIKHNQEMRAAFPNLYDMRWVEKEADKGWETVVDNLCKEIPGFRKIAEENDGMNILAILYYSAFESSLNTFFFQCLDDNLMQIELIMDEFRKVRAQIKEKHQ